MNTYALVFLTSDADRYVPSHFIVYVPAIHVGSAERFATTLEAELPAVGLKAIWRVRNRAPDCRHPIDTIRQKCSCT